MATSSTVLSPKRLPYRLNIRTVLDKTPKPPDYVVNGLPVGAVGGLVAPGGIGKTFLMLQCSAAVAAGVPLLGGAFLATTGGTKKLSAQRVVYVMAEEPSDVVSARTHAVVTRLLDDHCKPEDASSRARFVELLDANLHLHALSGLGQMRLDSDEASEWTMQSLQELTEGARLVVLDPMRQFHAGDENASWDMTHVLQRLQQLAMQNRCAVLLVHHSNKASTANLAGDRAASARGSSAFTDALRWQVNLSQADDSLIVSHGLPLTERPTLLRLDVSKSNYLPPQPPLLLRRSSTGILIPVPRTNDNEEAGASGIRRTRRSSVKI